MNCSFRKTAVRWFAPAVFAIALTCFQTARATESTGLPESVAALDAPADPRDLIAAGASGLPPNFAISKHRSGAPAERGTRLVDG
jgi:hypothetical protein